MKVLKRSILIRGTKEEVMTLSEDIKRILDQANERLKDNQIAGIEIAQDFDGTIVYSLVVKESESDEEKRKFMEKLSKAKPQ